MRTGVIVDNKMDAETEKLLAAESVKDKIRMDWLLANSCIVINGIYRTSRESIDEAIASWPSPFRYECLCWRCGNQFELPSKDAEHICPACK